jgi:hypothetical protein
MTVMIILPYVISVTLKTAKDVIEKILIIVCIVKMGI